ncbi:MAG: hypothetical protein K2U26_13180 [Cyclobacteriaceae bacterium]|nr:hypothetical protein [Cyclobacteriaceae bacterium]
MKSIKRHTQFIAIFSLILLFINFAATSSIVGNFESQSAAIAIHNSSSQAHQIDEAAFPGILAAAAAVIGGAVLVGAFVVGFVDGYNCGPLVMVDAKLMDSTYCSLDFSKFDSQ